MNLIVIKLGGSLMGTSELSSWLNSIELASKNSNIIVVPGGGKFSNSIRRLQKKYQFDDHSAHQMALLAMCQYGYLLKEINPKFKVVNDTNILLSHLGKQIPLLWLPLSLIDNNSEIKSSWEFTSDSIALWLAIKLGAKKIILVKSKMLNNHRSSIINHIKINDIDKGFQMFIDKFSGEILFMKKDQYQFLTI